MLFRSCSSDLAELVQDDRHREHEGDGDDHRCREAHAAEIEVRQDGEEHDEQNDETRRMFEYGCGILYQRVHKSSFHVREAHNVRKADVRACRLFMVRSVERTVSEFIILHDALFVCISRRIGSFSDKL